MILNVKCISFNRFISRDASITLNFVEHAKKENNVVSMVPPKLAVPNVDMAVHGFCIRHFIVIVPFENMGELCKGK
jgi:hypothetical protein